MQNTIYEILVAPDTKESLVIDKISGEIQNLNKKRFHGELLNGNIPVILPKKEAQDSLFTDLHKTANSEFNYVEHYIKDAENFDYFQILDEITESERVRLNQLIVTKIKKDSKKILDVGCGNGWLNKVIQKDDNQVVSLDISPVNVQRVLEEHPHPKHSGVVADVFNLPFAENTFDSIVASEIIEHVYDPRAFVDCLLKVLKPNGKLIITTPYDEQVPYYLCVHCNKPTPRDAHLHSFNEKKIRKLVSNQVSQLKIETLTNKYFLKMKIYWLLKFLPFKLWHIIDQIAVKLLKKPTRLIMEITK